MRNIKLLMVLERKNYFILCVLLTISMAILYPYIQSLGNLEEWFMTITPPNFILYIVFSVLFGVAMTLQIYNIKEIKMCQLRTVESSIASVVAEFFVVQCPVCISFLTLFLPATAIALLTLYNVYISLFAVVLLIVTIYLLGGFKTEKKKKSKRKSKR